LLASLSILGDTELHVARATNTRRIHQDISNSRCDEVSLLALANVSQLLLLNEEKMLQEEGHDSGQNSTGPTFILENAVFDFLVEVEALAPRVVEVAGLTLKQQFFNSTLFLSCEVA